MKNNEHLLLQNIKIIHALPQRAATLFGDRPFLLYKKDVWSYQQCFDVAMHYAHRMIEKGVLAHEKVLIIADNSPLFYVGYCATWQIGAVVVPVNNFLKSAEIEHIINDCKPSFIICDQHRLKDLKIDSFSSVKGIMTEEDFSVEKQAPLVELPLDKLDEDDLAVLVYTSGTTGAPKGVMLSSKNILTNIRQCIQKLEINENERVLCVLPLFHVFTQITCVWIALAQGISVVIVPKIERSLIIDGLSKHPTIIVGVPALFGLFCLFHTLNFWSVRLFIAGGDAMPDKIRSLFALLYGRKIINGYGLSEASPVVAANLDDVMSFTNTIGKPLDGIVCKLEPREGQPAIRQHEPYQIGQLFIKGANIMCGYYQDEAATQKVLHSGWLDTGDSAYFDTEGNLVITGREKDLIISKGFNIYPQEVENIIALHTAVLRVAVVGKYDELSGELPVAFVQLKHQISNIEKELSSLCAQHLAAYKIPRMFFCSTELLPVTSTGKVDKKQLRKKIEP